LAAGVLWATFVAPNSAVMVPTPVSVALKVAVFGGAALALAAAGHRGAAAVLVTAALVNGLLMAAWGQ
jgi:hypothetical protein